MNICLIGNPNCGKTTLFNLLTGTYQRVGNFSGVTVEKKEGEYKKDRKIKIVDLPGLYSLIPTSPDENAVIDYLEKDKPEAIINVVDGTNLERNLYLTVSLKKLGIPMIVAVNMCDDLEKNDIKLNSEYLSSILGVPVIKISALKNKNVNLLMQKATELKIADNKLKSLSGEDIYHFIEKNIDNIIEKKQTKAQRITVIADNILTHRVWGIPIFICIITLVYFLSSKLGGALGELVLSGVLALSEKTELALFIGGFPEWFISLICGAVINGLGTVLSFLPQILVLFILLTIIEESGYSARIAFILDRLFRYFGLGGKSVLPLTVSCGCAVTGIMTTRNIENDTERKLTVFLSPLMPCGAKTAVFGWFAQIMFGGSPLIATSAYFLSIFCICVFGKFLTLFKPFKIENGSFLLEIPTLRFPTPKDVFFVLYEKTKDFLFKAGTVIFTTSVVLWFLSNVGVNGYTYGEIEKSFLFSIGNGIKYIFYPLGFGNWQSSVSVLSGILAKEAVIQTLTTLESDCTVLFANGFSAYSFMAFILLSPPCISALITAKNELKSIKSFAFMICFQFGLAYFTALVINLIGMALCAKSRLLFSLIIVIILIVGCAFGIKKIIKNPCISCGKCKKRGALCHKNSKRNTII